MKPRLKPTLLSALAVGLLAVDASAYTLKPAYPNVVTELPTSAIIPPDGSNRLFLLQQRGKILVLPKDESSADAKVFLDFTSRAMEAKDGKFEEGLLGLAFHPEFAKNRKFYVYYSQQDPKRSIVSEFQVSEGDPNQADLKTERILLEVPQPFWNHNSGNLLFGPDGSLYIAFGDGGKRDDVTRTAQNPFSLLGKILRIDVNTKQGSRQYGLPADNPFPNVNGTRPEIYALGLRNPWGLSFDADGTLWCADVGQDIWEEINLIEKGGNYGWSYREGARPFPIRTDAPPADAKFIEPIHEYPHSDGISITGGFIYRGEKLPNLKGAYIYGDWAFGKIWALKYDKAGKKVISNELIFQAPLNPKGQGLMKPSAFCEDLNKEILVLDWNGKLHRVEE
ncbi:PQQ-dependent sugar dehydrogenase [Verrucomicrobium spinosum]|uniref:PQQ-dependent sugar dehydrogenase n=1 Tax=Verrucomicrobium spinosum TaxID=2736 RepID=UPI00017449E6|nr:PQQ-dependent sugar dehydrogenase [Verrucomicrobium spinosum]